MSATTLHLGRLDSTGSCVATASAAAITGWRCTPAHAMRGVSAPAQEGVAKAWGRTSDLGSERD